MNLPKWSRHHHFLRGINDLTSPVGKELISDIIHQGVISSFALLLSGSMMKVKGEACLWFHGGVFMRLHDGFAQSTR